MSESDLFFCNFFYWFLCLLYCRFFAGTRIVLMRIKFGDAINIKDCHITARISGTPQLVGNLSVLQAQEGRHNNFRSPPHCELPRARFFEEKKYFSQRFYINIVPPAQTEMQFICHVSSTRTFYDLPMRKLWNSYNLQTAQAG